MSENGCIFSPRLRKSGDPCSGCIQKVEGLEARSCGYTGAISVCFFHLKYKKKQNENTCCYPLREENCSGSLLLCPQRFFKVFEEINPAYAGTFICSGHLTDADKNDRITSLDSYCPPTTRKVW